MLRGSGWSAPFHELAQQARGVWTPILSMELSGCGVFSLQLGRRSTLSVCTWDLSMSWVVLEAVKFMSSPEGP